MNRLWLALTSALFLGVSLTAVHAEQPAGGDQQLIQQLNRRYDDFFRHQHRIQAWNQHRLDGISEIKKERREARQKREVAREAYVKARRQETVDKAAEKRWYDQQKAWKKRLEIARRKTVERRNFVEQMEKKGRRIPPMQEYHLEDY